MNTFPFVHITFNNVDQAAAHAMAVAPAPVAAPQAPVPAQAAAPITNANTRRPPVELTEKVAIAAYIYEHKASWTAKWWMTDEARWAKFWSTVSPPASETG